MTLTQLQTLYKIQEIELEVIQRRLRLREIESALQDNEDLRQAQEKAEEAEKLLKPLQRNLKELEQQIEATGNKRKTSEERLYSGVVKNPKELQDMQQEITSLENWQLELEHRLSNLMSEVEQATQNWNVTLETLKATEKTTASEQAILLEEKNRLEAENRALLGERKEIMQHITPENMKMYSEMRAQKANRPLSLLNGTSCSVCGIEQSMITVQRVKKTEEFHTCRNCGRILVYLGG